MDGHPAGEERARFTRPHWTLPVGAFRRSFMAYTASLTGCIKMSWGAQIDQSTNLAPNPTRPRRHPPQTIKNKNKMGRHMHRVGGQVAVQSKCVRIRTERKGKKRRDK